jgi:hypothetical protein
MRVEAPVTRVRIWDGNTPWLINRYDDQGAVLTDSRFSADARPVRAGADDLFDQREDDGLVVLVEATLSEAWYANVRRAAAMCLALAITPTNPERARL